MIKDWITCMIELTTAMLMRKNSIKIGFALRVKA
jgi:hypothetical protein